MMPNPQSCPVCGAHWDYTTTWLGQLVAIHPVTRCVAPPPPVFEKDDEEEPPVLGRSRECEECHKMFVPGRKGTKKSRTCGAECRKVRRERVAEYKRALWKIDTLARLNFPIKTCVQCGETFIPNTKFSAKQILCGSACVAARQTEQARAKYSRRKAA